MLARILVMLFAFTVWAKEPPVALWGSWMGKCLDSDQSHEPSYRTFYRFDSEYRFVTFNRNYSERNCTGDANDTPLIEGSYMSGDEELTSGPDSYFQIDLEVGPNRVGGDLSPPGKKYYQIYTVRKNILFFGKTWTQVQQQRPNQLNREITWSEVSP